LLQRVSKACNTDVILCVSSDCCDVAYSLEALKLADVASEQEQVSLHTLLEKAMSKYVGLLLAGPFDTF
jgi:hypothetical protein